MKVIRMKVMRVIIVLKLMISSTHLLFPVFQASAHGSGEGLTESSENPIGQNYASTFHKLAGRRWKTRATLWNSKPVCSLRLRKTCMLHLMKGCCCLFSPPGILTHFRGSHLFEIEDDHDFSVNFLLFFIKDKERVQKMSDKTEKIPCDWKTVVYNDNQRGEHKNCVW